MTFSTMTLITQFNDTLIIDIEHNDTQNNDIQDNDTQLNDIQDNNKWNVTVTIKAAIILTLDTECSYTDCH